MKTQRKMIYALWLVVVVGALLSCRLVPQTAEPTEKPPEIVQTESPEIPPATSEPAPSATPESKVEAESDRDRVFTISTSQQREALPVGESIFLVVGEGVDVDEVGRALLNFVGEKFAFQVEVLRDGELIVQELAQEEQSVAVQLLQNGGTFLNQFDAQEEIDQRITINTEFAEITATGTQFMIVKEVNTPLEWVVGLDAGENDLQVSAQGVTKDVVAGQTRWIAPIGEPSAGIEAQMDNVSEWIENLSAGKSVREIGQVVWDFADISTNMRPVMEIPPPGEFVEMPGGIRLSRLAEGGYALKDCNQDGVNDLEIIGGAVSFDFTNVLGRVQSLDATIANQSRDPYSGVLRLFNPAYEEIDATTVEVGAGQGQVIALDSDQAVHYASLELSDGCLLGISVTPLDVKDRKVPVLMAEITGIRLEGITYVVDFSTYGYQPALPGMHVHFFFNTVTPEQAGRPGKGPWILYGGESPFTEYTLRQKPSDATQMCILVANPDHSVQPNSGNCYDLPVAQ